MSYLIRYALAASTMAVAVVQIGCSRESRGAVGTTETTSASWISIDDGVHKLAAERCEREVACNNVGQDRKFSDRGTCMSEMLSNTKTDLRACSGAIDSREFNECLDAVHVEQCGNPVDTGTRMKACRAEEVCARLQRGSLGM